MRHHLQSTSKYIQIKSTSLAPLPPFPPTEHIKHQHQPTCIPANDANVIQDGKRQDGDQQKKSNFLWGRKQRHWHKQGSTSLVNSSWFLMVPLPT